MVDLPSAEHVAFVAVCVLAAIVVWDAYWLTKQRRDVPELGSLPGGGFAWSSEGVHEMIRQWGNLGSMAAMMVLPGRCSRPVTRRFCTPSCGMFSSVCT